MSRIRTRFAPSPTGFMHLGGLRTALYARLFAKKNGGDFILRIEDTDAKRYVKGAVEVIYSTLKECGLTWDEGPDTGGSYAPYIQSERMKDGLYIKYADELIEKGVAYYCGCQPDRENPVERGKCPCRDLSKEDGLKLKGGNFTVIRQKAPLDGATSFKDEIYGEITVENSELEDQILIKSDGMPTYSFANVIDDHSMGITHVIRGNEFLSSTPKHVLLYRALGWAEPAFIHCAPIMRDASHKLSKRDGDAYFSDFRDKGYLTEAIINYIALLGWSPRGESAENEIFSLEELTKAFDIKGMSKSPAIFDQIKMRAINAEYIRKMSPEEFRVAAAPFIPSPSAERPLDTALLCAALQQRTEVLSDIAPQVDFIENLPDYDTDLFNNKKMKTSPQTALEALEGGLSVLDNCEFTRDGIYDGFKALSEQSQRKIGWYLYPLQVALSGKPTAPGGGLDICVILGKKESVARITRAIDRLKA